MCRISTVFDSPHSFLQIQIFLLSEELLLVFLIINCLKTDFNVTNVS